MRPEVRRRASASNPAPSTPPLRPYFFRSGFYAASGRRHPSYQAPQHFSDFDRSIDQGRVVSETDGLDVTRQHQVILEFCRRVGCVTQEPSELAPAILTASFHDIGGNGHRRADHLTSQRQVCGAADPAGNSVDSDRKLVRLPPDFEFSEIAHTSRCWLERGLATPFSCDGHQTAYTLLREE